MSAESEPPSDVPPGWSGDGTRITRTYGFASFPQAVAFMVEVSFFCETIGHHPDWANSYRRVSVALTTHDAGRVTKKDVRLARHMDNVHTRLTGQPPPPSD